jgi:hypothetical protein
MQLTDLFFVKLLSGRFHNSSLCDSPLDFGMICIEGDIHFNGDIYEMHEVSAARLI